jgi:hypothetical protein
MPRFALQQISPIDYRSSLPEKDPNNAIWPRISAFAKMLHDISWEDDDEYDDGTGRTEEERKADFEQNARENVKTSEDRKMDGYSEYPDDQSRLIEEPENPSRSPTDMERQKSMADSSNLAMDEFVKNFDPKTASKEDIRKMQRIVAPDDAVLSDPDDKPSTRYFDDADWGEASQKAFEDYLKQWGYR